MVIIPTKRPRRCVSSHDGVNSASGARKDTTATEPTCRRRYTCKYINNVVKAKAAITKQYDVFKKISTDVNI